MITSPESVLYKIKLKNKQAVIERVFFAGAKLTAMMLCGC